MKALFELFRRFDARRIFGFIRRLGGMSRPKVKCYDLRSTHALRVEGDRAGTFTASISRYFYPRPPGGGRPSFPSDMECRFWNFYPRPPGGGRPRGNFHGLYIEIFLSTPSGWRATRAFHTVTRRSDYFYPRPPGGGRQLDGASKGYGAAISIHALRVEGDGTMMRFFPSTNSHFYPRPPGGGRRRASLRGCFDGVDFYPRPPGGGRLYRLRCMAHNGDFYPRPPGGGRPRGNFHGLYIEIFLSTPSGWRATVSMSLCEKRSFYFYPRPPGGGRQQKRTKFSSVFAQKGEEIASLRRGKRKFAGGVLKRTNFGF